MVIIVGIASWTGEERKKALCILVVHEEGGGRV